MINIPIYRTYSIADFTADATSVAASHNWSVNQLVFSARNLYMTLSGTSYGYFPGTYYYNEVFFQSGST